MLYLSDFSDYATHDNSRHTECSNLTEARWA